MKNEIKELREYIESAKKYLNQARGMRMRLTWGIRIRNSEKRLRELLNNN